MDNNFVKGSLFLIDVNKVLDIGVDFLGIGEADQDVSSRLEGLLGDGTDGTNSLESGNNILGITNDL